MQFIKFKLFLILNLLISINAYANHLENNNKAIALPAMPFIVEGVKDTLIATGTALGASALLKGDTKKPCNTCNPPVGTKVNLRYDPPGSRPHYPCKIEEGHWQWQVVNQDPNTCRCFNNSNSKKFVKCGPTPP